MPVNRHEWNELIEQYAPPSGAFLQTWEWGEFQQALGFEVVRVHEVVRGKQVLAQAIKLPLPLKAHYWHVPKGPLGDASPKTLLEVLEWQLPSGAFLKIEPLQKSPVGLLVSDRQPAVTTIIDLTQTEAEINENMKAKTRYNIRLAQKKGVITRLVGMEHFDDFIGLMRQTAKRDNFSLHEPDRYRRMLETLSGPGCKAFMATAFYDDHLLAANLMLDACGVRTYLHGASSNMYRNLMAPYALHDFLIRDAKAQGLLAYDFWGIAPPEAGDDHPWAGISRFKTGFGGNLVRMPGTFDVPRERWLYALYRLVKKMR